MRRNKERWAGLVIGILIMLVAGATMAKDWPQWRGPVRDGISQETGLLASWPAAGPKVLWHAPLGGGFSSMAVADGRVLTEYQTKEAQWTVALDEKTGQPLWKVQTGKNFAGSGFPGPRSTPTVDGKNVYIMSPEGDLFCLKAATGKEIWKTNILTTSGGKNLNWGLATSPLIADGLVLVSGGETKDAVFVALNKKSGKLAWKTQGGSAGYASPIACKIGGKDQVLYFASTGLVSITPKDGKVLWTSPWKTRYDINATTPIVNGDTVFVGSGYGAGCMLVKVDMAAKEPATQVWKSTIMRTHFTTPVLIGGYLYGFDDNILRCVEYQTGKSMWESGEYKKGTLVAAGQMLYVLGEEGNLALIKATPEKLEKVSEVKGILGKRCWTMPVIANGRLYIRDETKLVCLDVKGN